MSTKLSPTAVKRPPNLFPQGKLVILEDTGSHRDKKKKKKIQTRDHIMLWDLVDVY